VPSDELFTDAVVSFSNSQGLTAHGTLIRLTRDSIVFEVYDPYSIVQMSEVLQNVRIRRGERDVYSGRATVVGLINTGLMLVVSASLLDPWSDMVNLAPGPELRDEVARFVGAWSTNARQLQPSYVHSVIGIRNFLEEFRRWLDHGEAAGEIDQQDPSTPRHLEFVQDVAAASHPALRELFERFEDEAAHVEESQLPVHKAFARRQLHPLILCSPFAHRSYSKPLGYAGDYEMVNMMLRPPWEGNTAYAKVLNAFFLDADTARAHRFRIDRLTEYLEAEVRRTAAAQRACRVLNIGCGPSVEVQRFLEHSEWADHAEIVLVDFNEQTLEYARQRLEQAQRGHGRHAKLEMRHLSVHDLLRRAAKGAEDTEETYDYIYCAGLFDYFGDRVCSRLVQLFYQWLRPEGLVLVTNVHPRHPVRGLLEHVQEWYLILRDEQAMLHLAPGLGTQSVSTEQTGVNVFLEVRKPAQEDEKACRSG